jgi:mRNA interferase RelE/StbE
MYDIQLKPRAVKDLRNLPKLEALRVGEKLKLLEQELSGDVKRLTDFTPEYRLRVGDYRALFEVENSTVVVYRILHRRYAYEKR